MCPEYGHQPRENGRPDLWNTRAMASLPWTYHRQFVLSSGKRRGNARAWYRASTVWALMRRQSWIGRTTFWSWFVRRFNLCLTVSNTQSDPSKLSDVPAHAAGSVGAFLAGRSGGKYRRRFPRPRKGRHHRFHCARGRLSRDRFPSRRPAHERGPDKSTARLVRGWLRKGAVHQP